MTNPRSDNTRLGKYITRDTAMFDTMGWEALVRLRRGRGDLNMMEHLPHPAKDMLSHLSTAGAPAVLGTPKWSATRLAQAIRRGPHQSCNDQHDFLEDKFADFVEKAQWIALPYSRAKKLQGLRLSPPGVVPQRGRRAA